MTMQCLLHYRRRLGDLEEKRKERLNIGPDRRFFAIERSLVVAFMKPIGLWDIFFLETNPRMAISPVTWMKSGFGMISGQKVKSRQILTMNLDIYIWTQFTLL